MKKPVPKI